MASPDITLTLLMPSPYFLIYSIPLLLAAVLLTFAGAFSTLDRTCTFAPQSPIESPPIRYDLEGDKKLNIRAWWGLEGGAGGLASGWVFGAYLATFLSLLIMHRTSSAPLTPPDFLAIHLISSILFTFLSGRFKLAALACIGVAGGVSFALILAVVLHPTLLTRIIFAAILTPLFTIATLLPVERTQHWGVRVAAASAGAFGTVVSIALLVHMSSWADVWERLWLQVSPINDWGTIPERGLSAAACLLLVGGIASDWALRRTFGENPDQKWDAYLTQYASTLLNSNDRAGTFQPVRSLWQRLFHSSPLNPVLFPSDSDLKRKPSLEDPIALPKTLKLPRKRSDIKFQPLGGYSDSDSDSDSDTDTGRKFPLQENLPPQKPWVSSLAVSSASLSGATLYGSDDETGTGTPGNKRVRSPQKVSLENYSDSEGEDITTPQATPVKRSKSRRDEPGWKPDFLSRREHDPESPPTVTSSSTAVSHIPAGAVPMTTSLIRAIDRIAIAQSEAYAYSSPPPLSPPPLPRRDLDENWRHFWAQVHKKAHE